MAAQKRAATRGGGAQSSTKKAATRPRRTTNVTLDAPPLEPVTMAVGSSFIRIRIDRYATGPSPGAVFHAKKDADDASEDDIWLIPSTFDAVRLTVGGRAVEVHVQREEVPSSTVIRVSRDQTRAVESVAPEQGSPVWVALSVRQDAVLDSKQARAFTSRAEAVNESSHVVTLPATAGTYPAVAIMDDERIVDFEVEVAVPLGDIGDHGKVEPVPAIAPPRGPVKAASPPFRNRLSKVPIVPAAPPTRRPDV